MVSYLICQISWSLISSNRAVVECGGNDVQQPPVVSFISCVHYFESDSNRCWELIVECSRTLGDCTPIGGKSIQYVGIEHRRSSWAIVVDANHRIVHLTLSGVMVRVSALSPGGRRFAPRSSRTKDFKNGPYCFLAWSSAFMKDRE